MITEGRTEVTYFHCQRLIKITIYNGIINPWESLNDSTGRTAAFTHSNSDLFPRHFRVQHVRLFIPEKQQSQVFCAIFERFARTSWQSRVVLT